MNPTLRDIAEKIGVSHTTVALALRGDARISAATRQRILREATRLGYRPNAIVSHLMAQLRTIKQRGRTATLGFITAWPTRDGWRVSPNHRLFFQGVQARAAELGYSVDELWLREPGMTARRMTDILRARGIQGILLQSLPRPHGHLSLGWEHFAAVAKGLTISRPLLHRVISSHYEDMRLAVRQLRRRHYTRIGLVLDAALNARVDQAWLAAYVLYQNDLPARDRVPALILEPARAQARFGAWLEKARPEVVLFAGLPVPAWVAALRLQVPRDLGLVHIDWTAELAPLTGIDSNAAAIGSAAVDLVVGQLHANEFGIPRHEKIITVKGRWEPGRTIR